MQREIKGNKGDVISLLNDNTSKMKAWNKNVALIYYDSSTSSFCSIPLLYSYTTENPKELLLIVGYIYGYLLCLKLKYFILYYLLIYYNDNKSIVYKYKLHISMKN